MSMKIERNSFLIRGGRQTSQTLAPIPEDRSVREMELIQEVDPYVSQLQNCCNSAMPCRLRRRESAQLATLNFEMINEERVAVHGLQPFVRSAYLDYLAQDHADRMACNRAVEHSVQTITQLRVLLESSQVASNVQRGDSLVDMHTTALNQHDVNKRNLLSTVFAEFGMGVSMGEDNKLYTCQYFRT